MELPTKRSETTADQKPLLGSLSISLALDGLLHPLEVQELSTDELIASYSPEWGLRESTQCLLEYNLAGQTWNSRTTVQRVNSNSVSFSLKAQTRPAKDARLSKRWITSSMHPIAARIQSDIAAGQWISCSANNISIGGAQLTLPKDYSFFVGQKVTLQIYYPLQSNSAKQKAEIVDLDERRSILNIRFSPITTEHIQSVAQHLIRFEHNYPPSDLELDLRSTDWPAERVDIHIGTESGVISVEGKICGESICSVSTTPITTSQVKTSNILLDQRWDKNEQLKPLLLSLINHLRLHTNAKSLTCRSTLPLLPDLGFQEGDDQEWVLDLDVLPAEGLAADSTFRFPSVKERYVKFRRQLPLGQNQKEVSWDEYGLVYDRMCAINPSYQELLSKYKKWIAEQGDNLKRVVDIGAGTGSFTIQTALALPNADVLHIDRDIVMNLFAQEKYRAHGLQNTRIQTTDINTLTLEDDRADLVTAMHSLYTLDNPKETLNNIHRWLKPGGYFYVVDIGRTIDTNEWARHIFKETAKERGVFATAKYIWNIREAISQNKRIQATQDSGDFWNRSHEEFREAILSVGFAIEHSEVTYRGNSDLAICRKL